MSSNSGSVSSQQPTTTGPTNARRCLCESVSRSADDGRLPWDYAILCSACCQRALQSPMERHERALLEREKARERCSQRLANVHASSNHTFSELQFESQRLRQRRAQLQQQCAALAVQVAAQALQNEERRESLHPLAVRGQLQRIEESVCEGSLKAAIANARQQVRILRFQWALKAFAMHRLDVRPEDLRSSGKVARGIGKIGGLPLPHAGPELYGVLPPEQLQSALRLVASISHTVARCLGILLPHPVLLQRTTSYHQGDIIHSALLLSARKWSSSRGRTSNRETSKQEQQDDPTSTESLMALLNTSLEEERTDGRKNQNRELGLEERANSTVVPPSMDPTLVSQRIRHATAAVLAEAEANGSSQYVLNSSNNDREEFAVALQFLQNNVIALSIRAGVPVAKLWPAEAVLLNLYALQVFCEDQVKQCLK